MSKKAPNIYPYTNAAGKKRYSVCRRDAKNNQYIRPLDKEEQRLTGCYAEYAKKPQALGEMTLSKAKSRARQLYGYAKIATPDEIFYI